MSVDVQLEFNIENKSADELRAEIMQKQIDALSDSLTKVRKKLFAEVGALKKILGDVLIENEHLKDVLGKQKHDKIEWLYKTENGCLFDVRESQEATCGC
jgi:hypothetical protein